MLGGLITEVAIGGGQAMHAALVIGFVEADLTAFQHPTLKAVVGQADAAKGLRQHAGFAAGNYRVGQKQVAGFKFGIESTDFQCSILPVSDGNGKAPTSFSSQALP